MPRNKQPTKKKKEITKVIVKESCCRICDKPGVNPRYSKYHLDPEYYARWVYICDDCPTIWVLINLGHNRFERQELSDYILKPDKIIPF